MKTKGYKNVTKLLLMGLFVSSLLLMDTVLTVF